MCFITEINSNCVHTGTWIDAMQCVHEYNKSYDLNDMRTMNAPEGLFWLGYATCVRSK